MPEQKTPAPAATLRCCSGRGLLLWGVLFSLVLETMHLRGVLTSAPVSRLLQEVIAQQLYTTQSPSKEQAPKQQVPKPVPRTAPPSQQVIAFTLPPPPKPPQPEPPQPEPRAPPPPMQALAPPDPSVDEASQEEWEPWADAPGEPQPVVQSGGDDFGGFQPDDLDIIPPSGGAAPVAASGAAKKPSSGAAGASVAYLVLGLTPGARPSWASQEDTIFPFVPPKRCPSCPLSAHKFSTSNEYTKAPQAWWCAQRYYMEALDTLAKTHSDKHYYFLADADTVVFPEALQAMVNLLEHAVLEPADDLYMGHGRDLSVGRFIMSGGGVLIRGRTLRRAAFGGTLQHCAREHVNGSWCWRHLDWVLADCLRLIDVPAHGHEGFNQFINKCDCCKPPAVACHPVKDKERQRALSARHKRYEVSQLKAAWAQPCPDNAYKWGQSKQSLCTRSGRSKRR